MKLIVGLAYVYILKNFSQYISLGYASTKTLYHLETFSGVLILVIRPFCNNTCKSLFSEAATFRRCFPSGQTFRSSWEKCKAKLNNFDRILQSYQWQ